MIVVITIFSAFLLYLFLSYFFYTIKYIQKKNNIELRNDKIPDLSNCIYQIKARIWSCFDKSNIPYSLYLFKDKIVIKRKIDNLTWLLPLDYITFYKKTIVGVQRAIIIHHKKENFPQKMIILSKGLKYISDIIG